MDPSAPIADTPIHYACLSLLSGPEPQKTILKDLLTQKLAPYPFKSSLLPETRIS
ncbi:hypothetical protein JCM15548_16 [Geofilum rubicundum JCM 15548]|uniref:Uncharacterized protein n=2 Tax=Geofilum TaxID=1236988 RepID=A0A0E9LS49_9BACT|nr:hypothetical protein JCM15548_16 [Geofilum rubicundum JCM 15548]